MNRKARQAVEWECRRFGARVIDWAHGQKHEIATVQLPFPGFTRMSFSRGPADEVETRRWTRKKLRNVGAMP